MPFDEICEPPINNKELYNEEDASYYCSFGLDEDCNNLTGFITEITKEQICQTGEYICDCAETKTETNEIVIVLPEEEDEGLSDGVILLGGVVALVFIFMFVFVVLACYCCIRYCCCRRGKLELGNCQNGQPQPTTNG